MDPFKQEALRLVSELIDAAHGTVLNEDQSREDEVRAALLAHIQRGTVRDGDDGKRVLREVFALCEDTEAKCSEEPGDFARGRRFEAKGIARAIGAWYQEEFCGRTHMGEPAAPAPDHFRDAAVEKAWERFETELQRGQVKGDAGGMVAEPADGRIAAAIHYPECWDTAAYPTVESALAEVYAHYRCTEHDAQAEVPMPEPVAYGIGNTAITGLTNRLMMVRIAVPLDDQYAGAGWHPLVLANEARTYGAACRAAGEAAGYARGLAEAGRLISLWLKDPDVQRMLEFARDASRKVTSWPDRLKGEAEASLRREAKPAQCDGNHGGPQCADPECWNDPVDDVIDVRTAAERLVKRALAVGVVLTIETQPRQPLAMGNYDLVVETREARNG